MREEKGKGGKESVVESKKFLKIDPAGQTDRQIVHGKVLPL